MSITAVLGWWPSTDPCDTLHDCCGDISMSGGPCIPRRLKINREILGPSHLHDRSSSRKIKSEVSEGCREVVIRALREYPKLGFKVGGPLPSGMA